MAVFYVDLFANFVLYRKTSGGVRTKEFALGEGFKVAKNNFGEIKRGIVSIHSGVPC